MPQNNIIINEAIDDLARLFGMPGDAKNLISGLLLLTDRNSAGQNPQDINYKEFIDESNNNRELYNQIADIILNITQEQQTTAEIITQLKNNYKDISKYLQIIYTDQNIPSPNNNKPAEYEYNTLLNIDDNNNTKVGIYTILPLYLSPIVRNITPTTLLLNYVPSVEWSRCVPYIDITFRFNNRAIENDKITQASLPLFLEGYNEPNNITKSLAESKRSNRDFRNRINLSTATKLTTTDDIELSRIESENEERAQSGMELLLSPQTMVNYNLEGNRPSPIIDPMRPLMSLLNLSIDVTPTKGLMSFKSAKLGLMLHDRSRLHEVADLIKPDLYSRTNMIIEYGWNYNNDNDDDNAWGKLINSTKIKENWMIANSSYSLDSAGQIKIDLQLFTQGNNDVYTSLIDASPKTVESIRQINQTVTRIKELIKDEYSNNTNEVGVKSVLGESLLYTLGMYTMPAINSDDLDGDKIKKVKNFIRKNKNSEIVNELKKLGITQGSLKPKKELPKGSQLLELQRNLTANLNNKFEKIKDTIKIDPFLYIHEINSNNNSKIISFGKLFSYFIIEPLRETEKFSEIQVMFYNFNSRAGQMRDKNISSYPIDYKIFRDELKKAFKNRRSNVMNLNDFLIFLQINFIGKINDPGYGVSAFYKKNKAGDTVYSDNDEAEALKSIKEKLREYGIPDGIFKAPHLRMTMNVNPSADGNSKPILRISISDDAATIYETQQALLDSIKNNNLIDLGTISRTEAENNIDINNNDSSIKQKLLDLNLIEQIGDIYQSKLTTTNLQDYLKNTIPTITYGGINSAVKNLQLSSLNNSALATVNLQRSFNKNLLQVDRTGQGGIPLRVIPGRLSMQTLGCPFLNIGQQFYLDVGTGTDLDGVYGVSKIVHTLSPGTFETSVDMVPQNAYGKYETAENLIDLLINSNEN